MGNADSKSTKAQEPPVGASSPRTGLGGEISLDKERRKKKNDRPEEIGKSKRISDDQVQVNLAMADLMAYLQVVANNSNHLPLTRRDDPELDRTVTSLSSEEYARKSAAFVPADIRVIGGTFTRYGRVWDLPTSEEYNASDGALEPGRSYGGACCNSMLKVVYDVANDVTGTEQSAAAAQALFEEDDDDEEETSTIVTKSVKSGFSLDYGCQASVSVSWANLLRQMKAEFKEIGYAQVPKVTTTRKIDLSKPFSLFPDDFDHSKGKKRSLLIACNYHNMPEAELKASHDDIRSMKDYIVNVHNFPVTKDYMTILMDDGEHDSPTFLNIIDAFKALSEESQPGDAVFVLFSGHGGRVLDGAVDEEAESYDEVLVPFDYLESGLIRDTLIFKTLLAPMRFGVTVTIMIDCCDNGMMLELPYSWSPRQDKKDFNATLSINEDFSFVRFLKVIKTLYESSTFTQLGRTVGSALGPMHIEKQENPRGREKNSAVMEDEVRLKEAITNGSSFFDALVKACSPAAQKHTSLEVGTTAEDEKKDELSPRVTETLFEKMINCTLIGHNDDEEDSDDETFKTRTYDDISYGASYTDPGESFDSRSMTTEEESRQRRRRRR